MSPADQLAEAERVLARSCVCHIAMCAEGVPYVVPVNFGYEPGRLYFHTGPRGRKLEFLKANPRVCFAVEADCELVLTERACGCSMKFRSVIGSGRAELVEDPGEKARALAAIARQVGMNYKPSPGDPLPRTVVVRIGIEEMTCRTKGLPPLA